MKIRFLTVLLTLFIFGCGESVSPPTANNQPAAELTVSAAVSLRDAFNEIGALYKTRTGGSVSFNFGASGALQRQIETGAPVDVFASAGNQQMDELENKNLVDRESRRDFARNTLVLIVPQNSRSKLTDFSDLTQAEIQKIAVGNPKTVPAGQYTEQFFEKSNLKNELQPKLIFAEDVRQVLDYVARGETDAGIVYVTDAKSAGEKVRVIARAPTDRHDPISYPLAIVADCKQKSAAQAFVNLILSPEGQAVLQKYGFGAPE